MKILLAAATEAEIAPLREYIGNKWETVSEGVYRILNKQLTIAVTGVGMMQTAYTLTKCLLNENYDLAIQAGIAGSFDRSIPLGSVVNVVSEQYGDLGAEDHDDHIDVFGLGLLREHEVPFQGKELRSPKPFWPDVNGLKAVKSLSVNTVSGSERTIKRLAEQYRCEVESMEGAAFHYVCLMEKIPFLQIRAISNYIEPRDKSKWQIGPSIQNLNQWLIAHII